MAERVYTFSITEREQDIEEAKKDAASAVSKLPAFAEFCNFLADGFINGLNPTIKSSTIDDAFDCMIDRDKVFITHVNPVRCNGIDRDAHRRKRHRQRMGQRVDTAFRC